jgi:hypothetical protein
MYQKVLKQIVVGIVALVLMVFVTACSGVGTTSSGGLTTLTVQGSVVSVNPVNHSVTLSFNGQTKTINGLTNDQVTFLQSQVGRGFSIQVTQNSDGTYNIEAGTNLQADETPEANATPSTNETPGVNEPGSIEFNGTVQSVSSNGSSIVVTMQDGKTLPMSINAQTDQSDLNGVRPSTGQSIHVEAIANTDGSFTATKLKPADTGDNANEAIYKGVTIQAVGSDRVIHFAVGNKSFSFQIASTADLTDFNNNAQSIGNNVSVKVTTQFSGTSGTVIKVETQNG